MRAAVRLWEHPSAMTPIRVLCVDDHPLLREGIAAVIGNQQDMVMVGEAANGIEALERFCALHPDVVLMDLQMPQMSGIDAIAGIRSAVPTARIVVLTAYRGDVQMARALKAGAAGYILKDTLRRDLLETIRCVHAGKRRIPTEVATELAEHRTDDALTGREIDVLKSVAAGNSNRIVADKLVIAEETVKNHLRSILSKLSANDRTHAVTIALKRGIIDV
jgi:DNA-binding NarL/FixJ family response regulator